MEEIEIWKPIEGYENNYAVSNYGRVKNLKTKKFLQGDYNSLGYQRVVLYAPIRKRFFIHRLVAYHFCKGYQPYLIVNHKDGNKHNNQANNLEWITHSENDKHAFQHKLRKVNHTGNVYISWRVFDLNTNKTIKEYISLKDFFQDYPLTAQSHGAIDKACTRQYFYIDKNHPKKGKIGIQRIYKEY